MKRCPTCQKTYTDQNLSYCIDDGTPLVPVGEDETTKVRADKSAPHDWNAAPYRPPGVYVPTGTQTSKRKVWPWVAGVIGLVVVAVVGLTIAAAVIAPSLLKRPTGPAENPVERANQNGNIAPSTAPSPNIATENTNAVVEPTPNSSAPTDKDEVLAQLTDLEHEWTVANINADKKALDRILADDYVGPDADGKLHGKREYIRDIKRDTSIQKWDFEDLKVTLRGDRATLTGKVRLTIQDRELVFEFVDKFVWRDGRWQATGSVVTPA